jgi:DnaK suppressor protein
MRHGRTDRLSQVRDALERLDTDIQEDIDRSLLQRRADTRARIDAAVERLDAGRYGSCVDCDGEIAERRLRALPFAVRCQACEEKRETAEGQVHRGAAPRSSLWLFPETIGV